MKKQYLAFRPPAKVIHWALRPGLHLLCLITLFELLYRAYADNLGTNPVETLTHVTGETSLRLLIFSLFITPLNKFTGNPWLVLFRRPLGLYAFFYALIHFLVYLIFDQSLTLAYVLEDIADRPYITVGFSAFVLMIPLTITSTKKMRRRLAKQWQRLHNLTYVINLLAIVHLTWITRADYGEALSYGAIFLLLVIYKVISSIKSFRPEHKVTSSRI
ncbi:MAG: sulfoxide reductase heme-binding subunit YedZ [Alteromonadaceae bacterium]|nr:MAG: sulfoxide reductase heme-binding subunit YedZ [Alteromonadaceae bacterium]